MTEPTFSESDFEIEVPESRVDSSPDIQLPEEPSLAPHSGLFKRHKVAIGVGSAIAACFVLGGAWYFSGSDDLRSFKSTPIESSYLPDGLDLPSEEYSVAYGDDGVEINNVESKIAETLLNSRPTHIEVSELINKRLDSMFEDPENLAKLRELNRGDRQSLQRDMALIRENISMLRAGLDELKTSTSDLKKSQHAIESRQNKLEQKLAASAKKSIPAKSKKVVLEPMLPWELVALGEAVAIIKNTKTHEKIRVAVGHSVPGCGRIKSLNVDKRAIETSQGCLIKRIKG